jgi:folate-dependent phosphoribosylglycinamide formyltransferase PurN
MASMNRKLKIGLLLDSYQVPLWFAYMIEKIIEEGFAEISLIVLNQSEKKQKKIFFRVLSGLNTLIFRVFYSFENRMFKVKPDALKAVNIKEILPGVPTIQVTPLKTLYSDYFQNTDLDTLQSHNLDLFIRKGFRILRGKILTSCPLGIWSFHHGDTHAFRGGPPAFWEVMKNDPVTGCVLQILTEDLDNGIILSKGYASTDRMSVKKNRNNIYWKSAEMIPRKLKEIHRGSFYPDFNNVLSRDYLLYPLSINKVPGNSTMLPLLLGHAIRILRKKIRHQFFIDQWILMFDLRKNNTSYFRPLSRFKKIIPPSDRFWADPNLVHENGRY